MTTALVVVVVVAAGLACPVHMWWRMRRGQRAACCLPAECAEDDVGAVQRRQEALRAQLAALVGDESRTRSPDEGYAVRP